MRLLVVIAAVLGLAIYTTADPTWPSPVDELEEIMFQLHSFRARKFADTVNPCENEASGPGRLNAAEWLRTAFHDMSTGSVFFGTGGLDASLQYELANGENKGPGLTTTLEFMAPYVSKKSSLSDLVAMGVYTSVRSCGGPVVPIRAGRVDATKRGSTGVPQPQNSIQTFESQFARMGFDPQEMIQLTACGHTLGGVHKNEFPDIVIEEDLVDGGNPMDKTVAKFDNAIVVEYLNGTTRNPLVIGPSGRAGKNSDFKVFNRDGNVTMEAMAAPQSFRDTCKTVLQKMIEVVPTGVELSDPITPYMVKPVELQLTLNEDGKSMAFTGYIRVKTTNLAKDGIKSIIITYKDRNGGSSCGPAGCKISATVQGASQGFDDTFAFFPIKATIPTSSGISSFTVTLNNADGTTQTYDNNGKAYPLQDAVLLQLPQSCVLGSSGALTVTAAIRNNRKSQGAKALISYKEAQTNSPVPRLREATLELEEGDCVGDYTFFSADYIIPGGLAYQSRIDVVNGDASDSFKAATELGGTCHPFEGRGTCSGGSNPPSQSTFSSVISKTTVTEVSTSSTSGLSITSTMSISDEASTSTSSTASPSMSASHREVVGGYSLVSCWTDDDTHNRTLGGKQYAGDDMTLEGCMDFCEGFVYWGAEYGRECFCGDSLRDGSEKVALSDCSMVCEGDATQYCGNSRRLELYSTTEAPAPKPTPTHVASVGSYGFVGCWSEGQGKRTLSQRQLRDDAMTNELCAEECQDFRYFGTEYGNECYCGSHVAKGTDAVPLEDCDMACTGQAGSYCGGRGRLELYMNPDIEGGDPEQPAAAGTFAWKGCFTDDTGRRALDGKTKASDNGMTNDVCAEFCEGFKLFGTEYGKECFCGDELSEGSDEVDGDECEMLCSGSVMEFCGASSRLSVYKRREEEVLEVLDTYGP